MKYNPAIALAYYREMGLPKPELEYKFHPDRRWRFDFAWPDVGTNISIPLKSFSLLALEVDGGIWIRGGHNRGAQMKKDWEKRNEAAALGWRIIYVEPRDLCTEETVNLIKRCLWRIK